MSSEQRNLSKAFLERTGVSRTPRLSRRRSVGVSPRSTRHGSWPEVDASPGQTGAILRREGLYSSHLGNWRKARSRGDGQGAQQEAWSQREERGGARSRASASWTRRDSSASSTRARVIIDGQKKLAEVLGLTLPTLAELGLPPEDENE